MVEQVGENRRIIVIVGNRYEQRRADRMLSIGRGDS